MKYINKFIAVGLGFALTFTGANFVHSMFTSSATQKNIITIQKPTIEIKDLTQSYFAGKDTQGKKYNRLFIPVVIEGIESEKLEIKADVEKVLTNGTDVFKNQIKIEKGIHKKDGKCAHKELNDNDTDCIVIDLEDKEFGVNEKYNITITVKIKGYDTVIFTQKYGILKFNQSNDCNSIEGVRIQHSPLLQSPFAINTQAELLNEEVKELTELDGSEQQKE